jgi:preprotein translocase subunit SecA
MRAELLHVEQTVLLETLDTTWKDHLYAMDQLRDSISFRAFSQQDPRIEYKREGARLLASMLESIRERVTDYIFKARLTPNVPPPQGAPSGAPSGTGSPTAGAQQQRQSAHRGGGVAGGGIVGAGMGTAAGGYYEPPAPKNAPEPKDDEPASASAEDQIEAARKAKEADSHKKRKR